MMAGDASGFEMRRGNGFLNDYQGILNYAKTKDGTLLPVMETYDNMKTSI
jgi:hypothetical protein